MKVPMLVHGFNASIIRNGGGKYSVHVSEDAGATIDLMQSVFDYRFPLNERKDRELLTSKGRVCFFDGSRYFAFGIYPVGGREVAIVSVRCIHEMKREDALKYIDKGFIKATAKYQSFMKSKDKKKGSGK